MDTTSALLHSNNLPLGFSLSSTNSVKRSCNQKVSLRHFSKQFANTSITFRKSVKSNTLLLSPLFSSDFRRTQLLSPLNCSYTGYTIPDSSRVRSFFDKSFSLEKIKGTLSGLRPIDVIKISGVAAIVIAVTKSTVKLVFNPFFWMYFSWTWLFWPWFVAIFVAVYGLYCLYKHLSGEANVFEQLAIVTSAFTWLTLVPPAHFNGFLEGWPFVFFFVYHYFFFFNVSVRKRLYGDYYARPHDPKWDVNPPKLYTVLFCVGVMVAHWLAAFEGPELHQIPGGWNNLGIWVLIIVTLLMQYKATLYLAKYSEKVVVPTAVVQFGPYRWVRHPIYASTMLMFATYFVALRAPLSLVFLVAVCLIYYQQKAKLEEELMVETFGEGYLEYASKVRHKFIPFVY